MERLKQKKDEDEQRLLDAVFEQYREDHEESTSKTHIRNSFVRGEMVNASKPSHQSRNTVLPTPTSKKPASAEEARRLASEVGRKIMLEAQKKNMTHVVPPAGSPSATVTARSNVPSNRPPKPGSRKDTQKSKMTNLQMFKEELKQMQEMRQERRGLRQQLKQQYGDDPDTIDRLAPSLDNPYLHGNSEFADDPNTTNLYLSNLPAEIEMQDLYDTFGSFGPLASAKILFPRSEEEYRKSNSLSGFIAFMSRTDAERAMAIMSGAQIRGVEIRVSWARPVVLPSVPFFVPKSLRELAMPDPPSGLPFNAQPQSRNLRRFLYKYNNLPQLSMPLPADDPEMIEDYNEMLRSSVVRVVIPTERPLLVLIHRVIEFLAREGPMFEALLMERERMNPLFRFLFDNNHPTHVYYRWKLFSVLNGEDRCNWRLERFRMFKEGSWWEPPPHYLYGGGMPPQLYTRAYKPKKASRTDDSQRSQSRSPISSTKQHRGHRRSRDHNQEEEPRRRGVLSRSDREFLEDMLRELKPEKTTVGDAMVWCVEHADCAKEIVQCVFESLDIKETPLHKKIARFYLINDILGNCGIRLRDVSYYRKFFQDYMERIFISLNNTLETIESRIKAEQFRQRVMLCFRMWEDNSIYPRDTLINLQNVFLGLVKPMESDHDEDEEEDLDGVPMTQSADSADDDADDIDGLPLNVSSLSRGSSSHVVNPKASKHETWNQNTLDQFTSKWDIPETSEAGVKKRRVDDDNAKHDTVRENGDSNRNRVYSSAQEEERRRLLRDVELKVVKYQDDLESCHASNIDQKLTDYRKQLMKRVEKELENFDDNRPTGKSGSDEGRNDSSRRRTQRDTVSRASRSPRSRSGDQERDYRRRERSRSRDRDSSKRRRSSSRDRNSDRKRSRRESDRDSRSYHRDKNDERRRR